MTLLKMKFVICYALHIVLLHKTIAHDSTYHAPHPLNQTTTCNVFSRSDGVVGGGWGGGSECSFSLFEFLLAREKAFHRGRIDPAHRER